MPPQSILANPRRSTDRTEHHADRTVAPDCRATESDLAIIQGKRAIPGDTALRLGHWFQTSAQFWLNLQSAYDLRVASDAIGREVAALPTRPRTGRVGTNPM